MTRGGWTNLIKAKCQRLTTIRNRARTPTKFFIDYSKLLTTKPASPSHRDLQGLEKHGGPHALFVEGEILWKDWKEREGSLFKTTQQVCKSMNTTERNVIEAFRRLLARKLHVDQIVLFGSRARGMLLLILTWTSW